MRKDKHEIVKLPKGKNTLEFYLTEVNNIRVKHGVRELKLNKYLNRFAQWKAEYLNMGVLSHDTKHGSISEQCKELGISIDRPCCENLYYVSSMKNSKRIVISAIRSWMKSEGHKENLLYPDIKCVGFGQNKGTFVFVGAGRVTKRFSLLWLLTR